jgi:hypothetical protein
VALSTRFKVHPSFKTALSEDPSMSIKSRCWVCTDARGSHTEYTVVDYTWSDSKDDLGVNKYVVPSLGSVLGVVCWN